MTNKEYILKSNQLMIDAYLNKDFTRMGNWRILLNTLIDEEIKKNKTNKNEIKENKK